MEESLKKWIEKVTKKYDELGGMAICPFAKKAVIENKVIWSYIEENPISFILSFIKKNPDFELAILIDKNKTLTDCDLKSMIESLKLSSPDMIFLKDHPDNPGYINGVNTGNGVYPIILVQPREKLEESRKKLKKTKYYDYWSEEYLKEIWSYGSESRIV